MEKSFPHLPNHADPHDHNHDHAHHHHGHVHNRAPRAIIGAIVVTLIFMLVEFAGGWIANSLALMSDAAHMLTDVGALLLSLFAIWMASKPTTASMSFGYHRAEILGALASGLAIWLIAGLLVYEAILRMTSPPEVQGKLVFIVATIGLIANLASMRLLHGAKHENINVRAAYLHLLADALGSIGAIIAGAVLWLTDWRLIDPIITIFFAILMLVSSWELVKEAVGVLMESTPSGVDPEKVRQDLEALPNVQEVHDLHIWAVSSGRLALSVHLIAVEAAGESLLHAVNALLKEKYRIVHTTIQIEDPAKFRYEGCYDCAPRPAPPARS